MRVMNQRRDEQQRQARIEYTLDSPWPGRALWPLTGLAVILMLIAWRASRPLAAHEREHDHGKQQVHGEQHEPAPPL